MILARVVAFAAQSASRSKALRFALVCAIVGKRQRVQFLPCMAGRDLLIGEPGANLGRSKVRAFAPNADLASPSGGMTKRS